METTVERIVIMPATVGRWRKNLQPFSALRSFEQAQDHPACSQCGPGVSASGRARTQRADEFAKAMSAVIAKLKRKGFTSFEALAAQLNEMGIATSRGARWYASTVRNVLERAGDRK